MKYSALSKQDIEVLEKNGCSAEDWKMVEAAQGFDSKKVKDVVFKGKVQIGGFSGKATDVGDGVRRSPGIREASLQDVTLGNDCVIANVSGGLANLNIGNGVVIENVGTVSCAGESKFGNGHAISVYNEGGGRELKITDRTSAQIAYMTVMYRDNAALIAKLDAIADSYASSKKSTRATIGDKVVIQNCSEIRNVLIGTSAKIQGAISLREGTIDSSDEAPTTVGSAVTAEDFILLKGSSVKDGAMVFASLVGEGTKIGKQFSCENSTFFANCEGFHSEACSLFAGPYSVTHHRSTLLIAAMISFYNAGSGTNQSNHMYKLGPIHQGIMERGCKTGSFSYLLWPSRVGAFTAVMSKHYAHFDTADFPFSYIDEADGKSTLVPGMNFFTVGTMRDGEKWPARDRRKNSDKLDLIVFDVLSPFIGQKMLRGSKKLQELYDASEKSQEFVSYRGIQIKRLLLKTCKRYYQMALDKYFGDAIIRRIQETKAAKVKDILKTDPKGEKGAGEWLDLFGLLCPKSRVDALVSQIVSGKIATMDALNAALKQIFEAYRADEWNWLLTNFAQYNGKNLTDLTNEEWVAFFEQWKNSSQKLLNMVASDAQKEFEGETRTGFGIDGNMDADFEAVRGTFEKNKFVKKLKSDGEAIEKQFATIKGLIN